MRRFILFLAVILTVSFLCEVTAYAIDIPQITPSPHSTPKPKTTPYPTGSPILPPSSPNPYPLSAKSAAIKNGSDWAYASEEPLNTDPSKFYIIVDVKNQITTIYEKGPTGVYNKIVRQMICTTGAKKTKTPEGTFSMGSIRKRFGYFTQYKCYAQYWTQVGGGIYFHSVLYSRRHEKYLTKSSVRNLGRAVSHGCIRLMPDDAHWIYLYIPARTVITITSNTVYDTRLKNALKAAKS